MRNIFIFFLIVTLGACSIPPKTESEKYWTLDFFYFYDGKQTHTKSFQFTSRRDCFDAMYEMQVNSRKEPLHSGAGICSKQFIDNQRRTSDDSLGYK